MKKYIVILALLILVFAVACAQKTQEDAKEIVEETAEKIAEKTEIKQPEMPELEKTPVEVTPAPSPAEPAVKVEAKEEVDEDLVELLGLADQKVKSYKYLLGEPPDNFLLDTYFIKGNKVRIKLFEYDPYDIKEYFDNVYLDYDAKTAVGYCLNKKRCISKENDNTKKKFELDFEKYRKKTPYEWLKEVPNTAKIKGPQVHESRTTTLIEFDDGGKTVEMWIDDTYGLPVKIVIEEGSEEKMWNFNDFQANTLKDSDVEPPFV